MQVGSSRSKHMRARPRRRCSRRMGPMTWSARHPRQLNLCVGRPRRSPPTQQPSRLHRVHSRNKKVWRIVAGLASIPIPYTHAWHMRCQVAHDQLAQINEMCTMLSDQFVDPSFVPGWKVAPSSTALVLFSVPASPLWLAPFVAVCCAAPPLSEDCPPVAPSSRFECRSRCYTLTRSAPRPGAAPAVATATLCRHRRRRQPTTTSVHSFRFRNVYLICYPSTAFDSRAHLP